MAKEVLEDSTSDLYIIFNSKERTHAKTNKQNFVTQKKLMQNFLSHKKTRVKINRQKSLII